MVGNAVGSQGGASRRLTRLAVGHDRRRSTILGVGDWALGVGKKMVDRRRLSFIAKRDSWRLAPPYVLFNLSRIKQIGASPPFLRLATFNMVDRHRPSLLAN